MEPAKRADHPITRRGVRPGGGIDVLQLPQARATDTDCVEVVPGFRVHVMFGSIFEPRDVVLQEARGCKKWVPVIPHYMDGSVYQQWMRLGGRAAYHPGAISPVMYGPVVVVKAREDPVKVEDVSSAPSPPQPPVPAPSPDSEADEDDVVPLLADAAQTDAPSAGPPDVVSTGPAAEPPTKRSGFDDIDLGVLYMYDKSMHKLDEDFGLMAANLPEGSVLAFPAIGVNNGVSYFQSAYRMFYSVVSCLKTEGNPMRRLSGVVFMSPFAQVDGCASASNRDSSGVRTMQHMFNVVKAYRAAEGEQYCRRCGVIKQDAVLPCGHRICQRCATDIALGPSSCVCPTCGKWFSIFYPCYSAIDCSSFQCCQPKPAVSADAAAIAGGPQPVDISNGAKTQPAEGDPQEIEHPKECAADDRGAKECSGTQTKVRMMFVPCGHHSVHCEACYASGLCKKKCAVCGEPFYTAVPLPR